MTLDDCLDEYIAMSKGGKFDILFAIFIKIF